MNENTKESPVKEDRFARSDEEAEKKYKLYKTKDPFPKIESSLLNSADIEDYVAVTGMIYPFNRKNLISASFEVCLDGKVFCWNNKGESCVTNIEESGGFTLEKNSIAFVNLKTKFRIPDYIALRFNLTIKHVHRGILLGTGPLVDPGFESNLLIPLHNLTANEYRFSAGEGLIWVEVTKISKNQRWANGPVQERCGEYRDFPDDKKNLDPKYYFEKAAEGRPIRSSIPDVIQTSVNMAKEAKSSAEEAVSKADSIKVDAIKQMESLKTETRGEIEKVQRFAIIASIFAIGAILITTLGSIYIGNRLIVQLVQNSIKYVTDEKEKTNSQFKILSDKMEYLEKKIQFGDKTEKFQRQLEKKPVNSNILKEEVPHSDEKNK